jgi:hypothetical protein
MPTPKQFCPDCKKKMVYDADLSHKKMKSFWCLDCSMIIVETRFNVVLKNKHDKTVDMPVTSARRYIFKKEFPE